MLGKPKFTYDDLVQFDLKIDDEIITLTGYVYIVDAYGTFDQNEEPSYDIMVDHSPIDNNKCLYKHIRESGVNKVE